MLQNFFPGVNRVKPGYIDAHLHLQDVRFSTITDLLIENAQKAGVGLLLCNAVSESEWSAVTDLGKNNGSVIPFLGIHPWHAAQAVDGWEIRLADLLGTLDHFSGIGESGLDKTCGTDFTCQVKTLETHLDLAQQFSIPIVLHCVRSWGKMIDILESRARNNRLPVTMIHSFSGSYEMMKRFADLGCSISYSLKIMGPFGGKTADILSRTPVEQLLLETDAPARLNPLLFVNTKTITGYSEPVQIPAFYLWAARQKNVEPSLFMKQLWRNGQIYTNKKTGG